MPRLVSLGAVLAAIVLAAPRVATRTGDLFDRIYQQSRVEEAKFHTLTARFVETTVSTLLREPIVARGRLQAVKPDRLVMEYDGPEGKTLVLNGDRLQIRWANRPVRDTRDVAEVQKRVRQYFLGASADDLRRLFDIRATEEAGAYHVEMRPRRKALQEGLEGLHIWVNQVDLGLARMRMDFPGGDSHTIVLEDVRLNVPVDERKFGIEEGAGYAGDARQARSSSAGRTGPREAGDP